MAKIKSIKAREILDSRGNPTVEVDLVTEDGLFRSAVPSGASTGKHEAHELRDEDSKRYGGKGVLLAVNNINQDISRDILGMDPTDQQEIDNKMIGRDGTPNKEKSGANAILAVSMAVTRAGAVAKRVPLYRYISELGANDKMVMPTPMVLVLEGGKHADESSDFQEFMIVPNKTDSFKEAIRISSEIYQSIGKILKSDGYNINVGFEGAYGPSLKSNEKAFEIIVQGIEKSGYKSGTDISLAIDAASSEFFKSGNYELRSEKRSLSDDKLIDFYSELASKFPIFSIEDGLAQDEWESWSKLMKKLGATTKIVGDDLTVTNVRRLERAIEGKAINAILIKLNQIGTVTETIQAINLAKKHGLTSIVSHRSAETEDTFISDFCVGMGTGFIKTGATSRGERTAKYNQLLRIEEEMTNNF